MTHYLRLPISQLPFTVGNNEESGTRTARNVEGFVSYGPYCRLAPGNYFGGFYIRALEKSDVSELLQVSVRSQEGNTAHADRSVPGREVFSGIAGLVGLDFKIESESSDVELRLHVTQTAAIEVRSLVIFRRELI